VTPAKEVAEWLKTNDSIMRTAGLASYTTVSSWAIVVDLTWKKEFTTPIRNRQDSNGDINIPDPNNTDGQPVGATGDTIAVFISVKNQAYV